MNLLIVDDEAYVIDSIMARLNREALSIENIYTAFSVKEAQMIMEMEEVHVIISDIVMPQENGFDLIEWVRRYRDGVSVIFLTSYAEFDYARKAIVLDSVDYLLKPIDYEKLEKALELARSRYLSAQKLEDFIAKSDQWEKRSSVLVRDFWKNLVRGEITGESLPSSMEKYHVDYTDQHFWVLYLSIFSGQMEEVKVDKWHLCYELEKTAKELSEGSVLQLETVIPLEKRSYMLIGKSQSGEGMQECRVTDWKSLYKRLVDVFRQKVKVDVWCGAFEIDGCDTMQEKIRELLEMRDNSLSIRNKVLYLQEFTRPKSTYSHTNHEFWETLLEEGRDEELIGHMKQYLMEVDEQEMVTRKFLDAFQIDVVQMVYSWLSTKEIKAYLLFSDPAIQQKMPSLPAGMQGTIQYISILIQEAIRYVTYMNRTDSVTDRIRSYIDTHYQEEIRRETLAEMVYLHTDYMSRIFKKEVGMSISSYLLGKRVEEAKKLLSGTCLPINAVSINVGYSNFSYFTKMFKENTGYSPLEYRRVFSQNK